MNYIIFDLESTCWKNEKRESEVIEIGAVKLNDSLEIVSEFQTFIKPTINPELSEFCMNLTTISQSDVDSAKTFGDALSSFMAWSTDNGMSKYWLCSWGFYDKKMLKLESERLGLFSGWLKWHINLKEQFGAINKIRPCGMSIALEHLGIELDGTHHRGIDDARNIAKIFKIIFPKVVFRF